MKEKGTQGYILKLYVTGQTPNSIRAIDNVKKILSDKLGGTYELEVVDVMENPQIAADDNILATPTLSRILPPPIKRIMGDFKDKEKVLVGLNIILTF